MLDFALGINEGLTAMIDELDVGDDALFQNGEDRERTTNAQTPVGFAGNHKSTGNAAISKSVAEKRIERTRERNRKAQAKYRQRMKVNYFLTMIVFRGHLQVIMHV